MSSTDLISGAAVTTSVQAGNTFVLSNPANAPFAQLAITVPSTGNTFDSATITIQVRETAAGDWVSTGTTFTAAGQRFITVFGQAIRALVSGAGASTSFTVINVAERGVLPANRPTKVNF